MGREMLDKWAAERAQFIGIKGFLDYCRARKAVLCLEQDCGTQDWRMAMESQIDGLLYEFLGIDTAQLETERRKALDTQRRLNERNDKEATK